MNEEARLMRVVEEYLGTAFVRSELKRTDLRFIVPAGNRAAYSLDDAGNVAGLKLGYNASAIPLSVIATFRHLQRIVYVVSSGPIALPSELVSLVGLRFVWLAGGVSRLPRELFVDRKLRVFVDAQGDVGGIHEAGGGAPLSPVFSVADYFLSAEDDGALAELSVTRPDGFRLLSEAEGVYLTDIGGIEEPPVELLMSGMEAVRTYFEADEGRTLPLCELKVLLVGDGGSGKTSLVKALLGDEFDPGESQTHGISIRHWPTPESAAQQAYLHFWDFGGQEIMHATHQFFLSKRSMYVVVLDGRKEEDADYWLRHVMTFGGGSPIIVILNKIDQNPSFEVNRRYLQQKHAAIVAFVRVSCATSSGISELRDVILEQVASVPVVNTRWPLSWFGVKRQLEALQEPYISVARYEEICRSEGVADGASRETLVDFLHDIGVVLHFRDLALLDTHVLDPEWVTDAVYKIITSPVVATNSGRVHHDDIVMILRNSGSSGRVAESYPETPSYIVELMIKFEIGYRIDSDVILIPDLLGVEEPSDIRPSGRSVRFVFSYGYLPRSIMPRIIVRLGADAVTKVIDGSDTLLCWRTGVVLEDRSLDAISVVCVDYDQKKISIEVWGVGAREYCGIIRKVVREINSSFEQLHVAELVPLPDTHEVIDYLELVGLERAGRDELFLGRLGRSFSVAALLNTIDTPELRQGRLELHVRIEPNAYHPRRREDHVEEDAGDVTVGGGVESSYRPATWERAVLYVNLTGLLILVGYLVVRNQAFVDPNLMVAVRILLSLTVAGLGAAVPGMLNVAMTTRGVTIRAAGALALFLITYVLTPSVFP